MSREPRKSEENVRGNGKLIIYIVVSAIIATVIISYIIISNMIGKINNEEKQLAEIQEKESNPNGELISKMTDEDEQNSESVSTQIGKSVDESSKEEQNNNANNTTSKNTTSTNNTKANNTNSTNINSNNSTTNNANANDKNEQKPQEEPKKEVTFCMPVDGEIIRGFAKENLVYSETLQEWLVHQAIDIKANSRDVVKAAADGTVTAIKNDPRYGLTVIIEHDGGFKTIYSNLLTAEFVVEGEKVKQGQTLGTVGSSAVFEISDEPHLHFEMLKDSVYVDPTIYIK